MIAVLAKGYIFGILRSGVSLAFLSHSSLEHAPADFWRKGDRRHNTVSLRKLGLRCLGPARGPSRRAPPGVMQPQLFEPCPDAVTIDLDTAQLILTTPGTYTHKEL